MRKRIQKITGLIALSVSLLNHTPAFASEASVDDKGCDRYIGLKLHLKKSFNTFRERFSMGLNLAVGPFVEWKPLDQIGIETGLMYGYNNLFTGGFNLSGHLVNGWSGKFREHNKSDAASIDVDNVYFHTISIPCAIRFYPGNDRQFALYIGTRLIIPLSKPKRICYGSMSIGSDKEHTFGTYMTNMMKFIEKKENKSDKQDKLEIEPYLICDFGFDYHTSFGFIIGINGLGFTLGYECAKYLFK